MSYRSLLVIFVIALTARGAWQVLRTTQRGPESGLEFPDEQQYWLMAESLATGDGLRDELGFRAGRMPLYPAFLSLFTKYDHGIFLARFVQGILGAATACLAALIGARLGGRQIGLLAGLAVALDPFQVFFAPLLLTEAPFTAVLVLLTCILFHIAPGATSSDDRGTLQGNNASRPGLLRWLAAGVIAAVCVYLREASLGLVLFMPGFTAFCIRTRRAATGAMLAWAVVVVSLIPWAVRNKNLLGDYVFLTTRGGISLYDGLGPQADGSSDLGDIKDSPDVRHLGELERNRHFLRESLRYAQGNPGHVASLALTKAGRTWSISPNAEGYQSKAAAMVSAIWCIPLYVLALLGALSLIRQRRSQTAIFLLLPVVYFTCLHMIFVGSVRYRIPAMPMLEILAAIGLSAMAARFAQGRLNAATMQSP